MIYCNTTAEYPSTMAKSYARQSTTSNAASSSFADMLTECDKSENTGYFSFEDRFHENGYTATRVKPNFTPRPSGTGDFAGMFTEEELKNPKQVINKTRGEFKKRLNYGQGGMTLQQWDDVLADLEDVGLITNEERFYANGLLCPCGTKRGNSIVLFSTARSYSAFDAPSLEKFNDLWQGDPQKYLKDLDAYMQKYGLYSDPSGSQQAAFKHVLKILDEILQSE